MFFSSSLISIKTFEKSIANSSERNISEWNSNEISCEFDFVFLESHEPSQNNMIKRR